MLSRYPLPNLDRNTSKGKLHSNETVLFPSSEDEKPAVLLPPHQIVIGFDVPSEKSRSFQAQTSKSPRSVLESDLLRFDVLHRQSQSLRSPLSLLGSLLSGPRKGACTEGAALCHKVAVDAEEASNAANAHSACSKGGHVASNGDGAGAYHSSFKTDYLACHVRGNATCVERKSVTSTRLDYVSVGRTQPWNHGRMEHALSGSGTGTGPCHKTFLSRDCEDDDNEDGDDTNSYEPLFSRASPVSDYLRYSRPSADFLSKCFRCRRRLAQGKDIYMYRGDQAFCSQECRLHQIVVDKGKKSRPVYAACL